MYVRTGNTNYTTIRNLSFAPEVDITCQQIVSNEFSVEIITGNAIYEGAQITLYDDSDNVWANYWIYDCYRISTYVWRVIARDLLWRLDNIMMPATTYGINDDDLEEPEDIIDAIFTAAGISSSYYTIGSGFSNITVPGYAPEQTARERLQWVCFVIGAYIKTCFNSSLQILSKKHLR